jgi:hypothetical protein
MFDKAATVYQLEAAADSVEDAVRHLQQLPADPTWSGYIPVLQGVVLNLDAIRAEVEKREDDDDRETKA